MCVEKCVQKFYRLQTIKMHPFVKFEPIFLQIVNPFSKKSEPILQNEPFRILYPFRSPFAEKDSGLDTILSLFQLNPPSSE